MAEDLAMAMMNDEEKENAQNDSDFSDQKPDRSEFYKGMATGSAGTFVLMKGYDLYKKWSDPEERAARLVEKAAKKKEKKRKKEEWKKTVLERRAKFHPKFSLFEEEAEAEPEKEPEKPEEPTPKKGNKK